FDFHDATSTAESEPTVTASVGAAKLRGNDIVVTSFSGSNVGVSSNGKGGGFLEFGSTEADATVNDTVTTSIAQGADLFASEDISLRSRGIESANGESVTGGGGLIATPDANTTLEMGWTIKTTVSGSVFANRTLLVDSSAGFKANDHASASSVGLGTNSEAN